MCPSLCEVYRSLKVITETLQLRAWPDRPTPPTRGCSSSIPHEPRLTCYSPFTSMAGRTKKGKKSAVFRAHSAKDQSHWSKKKKHAADSRFCYSTLKSGWLCRERHEEEEQITQELVNSEVSVNEPIVILEESEYSGDYVDVEGLDRLVDVQPQQQAIPLQQQKQKRKRKNRLVCTQHIPKITSLTLVRQAKTQEWIPFRNIFVNEIMRRYAPSTNEPSMCAQCQKEQASYRYRDCFGQLPTCRSCLVTLHAQSLLHRVEIRLAATL